jgi:hypothetical protein
MAFSKDTAAERAKADLADRLGISTEDISIQSIEDKDFPDASLGAPVGDEMSAQMISSGWRIILAAQDGEYEYRADKYSLRLYDFEGQNIVIES